MIHFILEMLLLSLEDLTLITKEFFIFIVRLVDPCFFIICMRKGVVTFSDISMSQTGFINITTATSS